MRFLLAFSLIILFSFIAGLFFPWWSIALAAFLTSFFIYQSGIRSFLSGFLGVFLLWFFLALWIDIKNENLLSGKVALIFGLGTGSILLILITALVGGLVGGFASVSGNTLRSLIVRRKIRISQRQFYN
jgi:hypothetical protein